MDDLVIVDDIVDVEPETNNYYRTFYFFLFWYAIYTFVNICISENDEGESSTNESDVENRNDESGGRNGDEEEKRRELVRGRLEFQQIQILSPTQSRRTIEHSSKSESSKSDLESGEAPLSAAKETDATNNAGADADADVNANANADIPASLMDRKEEGDRWNSTNSVRASFLSSISFLNHMVAGRTDLCNQECCSICLDVYSVGDTVARLKKTQISGDNKEGNSNTGCNNHWFHEDCILEWLQNHDDCPLCREDMIN